MRTSAEEAHKMRIKGGIQSFLVLVAVERANQEMQRYVYPQSKFDFYQYQSV